MNGRTLLGCLAALLLVALPIPASAADEVTLLRVFLTDDIVGFRGEGAGGEPMLERRDSARFVPKCRVVESSSDCRTERLPNTPWSQTVIYELHVKGYTKLHPEVPQAQRGTFAGLGSPATISPAATTTPIRCRSTD